jgi:hypothetical protein
MTMFAWKDQQEAFGAFPPCEILHTSLHKAKIRSHICSECFAPIHINELYTCTVYKETDTGKMSQFKCHVTCPYEDVL